MKQKQRESGIKAAEKKLKTEEFEISEEYFGEGTTYSVDKSVALRKKDKGQSPKGYSVFIKRPGHAVIEHPKVHASQTDAQKTADKLKKVNEETNNESFAGVVSKVTLSL
jgi:hypothetical protein